MVVAAAVVAVTVCRCLGCPAVGAFGMVLLCSSSA